MVEAAFTFDLLKEIRESEARMVARYGEEKWNKAKRKAIEPIVSAIEADIAELAKKEPKE